jgi:hypothetical protein
VASPDNLSAAFAGWLAGIALVYGALFGSGFLLLGRTALGGIWIGIAAAGTVVLARVLPRMWSGDAAAVVR